MSRADRFLEFLEWLEKLNAKEYPHLKLKRKGPRGEAGKAEKEAVDGEAGRVREGV